MFRKLQLKLILIYTMVLICILIVSNTIIYFVLDSYNSKKLSDDVEQILVDIKSTEWTTESYENESNGYDYEDDDAYDYEGDDDERREYHGNEIYMSSQLDIIIPNTIHSFSYYFIYSNDGELLKWKSSDEKLYDYMYSVSNNLAINQEPEMIDLTDEGYGVFLVIKRPIIVDGAQLGYYTICEDVSAAFSTLDNLKNIMIIMTIIGTFIAFGIGYVFAGGAIEPIKAAYKAKERFVGDASHELRTPISIILLSMEALKRLVKKDDVNSAELIEDVTEEALKMKDLVEKLLFLARNDSGNISLQKEDINITELINDNIEKYKKLSFEKNISFEKDVTDGMYMQGDKKLIDSLISIIIDNAVKYNKENGEIYTEAQYINYENNKYVKIKIRDTGIGIKKTELNRVFERFHREDESRSKMISGYGLGLSIAKEIVENHQGKISVESQVGEGSAFTILLRRY